MNEVHSVQDDSLSHPYKPTTSVWVYKEDVIYLKMSRSDRNYVKKSGVRAFYDPKTDKTILLKMREDEAAGVVSHELMPHIPPISR